MLPMLYSQQSTRHPVWIGLGHEPVRLRLQVQRVTSGWEARFGARRAPGALPSGAYRHALGGGSLFDLVSGITNSPQLVRLPWLA